MSVPALIVTIPLEGTPTAYVVAETAEESSALRLDLEGRPVAEQVAELLDETIPLIRQERS